MGSKSASVEWNYFISSDKDDGSSAPPKQMDDRLKTSPCAISCYDRNWRGELLINWCQAGTCITIFVSLAVILDTTSSARRGVHHLMAMHGAHDRTRRKKSVKLAHPVFFLPIDSVILNRAGPLMHYKQKTGIDHHIGVPTSPIS